MPARGTNFINPAINNGKLNKFAAVSNEKYYAIGVFVIKTRIRLVRSNSFDAMRFLILQIGHCM